MRLVQTPVLEIDVEQDGPPDGRPLLLLHGWPDAPRGWRPVAKRLHKRGWRTIVPALRGSGATRFRSSETLRDGRGAALAADAIELLDALGLDRVPVVGYDWGARAAHTLAASHRSASARSSDHACTERLTVMTTGPIVPSKPPRDDAHPREGDHAWPMRCSSSVSPAKSAGSTSRTEFMHPTGLRTRV